MAPGYKSDIERDLGRVDGSSAGTNVGKKFSSGLKTAVIAGGGLLAAKVGVDFFKGTIDSASDLAETVSKSNTIFGANAAEIEQWAGRADTAIGQTKQQALDAAAGYGNLFSQLGIGSKQAAGMSTAMVELASDFASFHNADVSEVLNAQSAAFRGEYDAVQRFVPTINAAAVEQRALADSGKKTTKELTAQDKALAVQRLLMEGAGAATGDFARTSDGLANKQRILSARIENVKAKIGTALLPVVSKLTGLLADNLEPTIEAVGKAFGTLSGYATQIFNIIFKGDFTGGPFAEDSPFVDSLFNLREMFIEKVLPAIEKVGAFIRDNLKPILIGLGATLAVIISPVGALVAGLILAYTRFETFRNIVDTVVRFLATEVVPVIVELVTAIAEQFGNLVEWVQEHWDAISEAIGHVVEVISVIISTAVDAILLYWHYFGDTIMSVISNAWEIVKKVVETAIDIVAGIIETAVALINGDWGKAWDAFLGIFSAAWDLVKTVLSSALDVVKTYIGDAMGVVKDLVSGALDAIVGFFSGIGSRISRVAGNVFGFLSESFKSAVNFIIRGWNGLEFKIPGFDPPGPGPKFGGFTLGLPQIDELWRGGTARTAGLAIVGDRGPELLDLERGATVTPLNTAAMIAEAATAGAGAGPLIHVEKLETTGQADPYATARAQTHELYKLALGLTRG